MRYFLISVITFLTIVSFAYAASWVNPTDPETFDLDDLGNVTGSCSNGQVITYNTSTSIWDCATDSGGSVTSVALTAPTGFDILGTNPITTSGSFGYTYASGFQPLTDTASSTWDAKVGTEVDPVWLSEKGDYLLTAGFGTPFYAYFSATTTDALSEGSSNKYMTYPDAGIALSTGSAWDTSITNNSGNWNTAYGWGNHAVAGYLGQAYASSTYLLINDAFTQTIASTTFVDRADWTTIDDYPTGCTNQFVRTIGDTLTCNTVENNDLANSTISGISLGSNLANLTATNSTLTFSGTYNGSTARTIGINLSNANTWTDLQILSAGFLAASSTILGDFTITGDATTTGEFVNKTKNLGDYLDFFNGTFIEKFNATTTSDGSVVTMHLEQTKDVTANLTMRFSTGDFELTAPTSTALTAGSDTNPTTNYIYILESTKVLTKSTTGFPTDVEYIKVGFFYVQSAAGVQEAGGVFINQNWNDFAVDDVNVGHITHMTERERRFGAKYFSGVAGDGDNDYLDIPSAGTVNLKSTSGIVYQMHKQIYPAFDTSGTDIAHIANQFGNSFATTTNLFLDITDDSTGTPIGNSKYFNIFIWGVANRTGQHVTIMINLPSGTYATQGDAEQDRDGFDNVSIPREFSLDSSTGFPIARLTIQKTATTWVYKSTVDCREQQCTGGATGGSLGALTNFSDNVFTIFDEGDNTKIMNFQVSGILSGNTRTLTIQNADGTIAYVNNQTFTGLTIMGQATTTELTVDVLFDSNGDPGGAGEVLSSLGGSSGTDWIASSGGATQLSDLSDVVSAANTDRYILIANGTTGYVGRTLEADDVPTLNQNTSGQAGTVANATFTTALTVNGGTLTLTAAGANNSVLTIGAGAVSVSGSNTGDNAANTSTMFIGTTEVALNRSSATLNLAGIGTLAASGVITSAGLTIGSAIIDETELEILDGATVTTTQFNYINTLSSNAQTQIDSKSASFSTLTVLNSLIGETIASTTWAGASSILTVGALTSGSLAAGFTDVPVAQGGTGQSSFTQYLMLYADTTTSLSQISIGSSGQVLTSNGGGSVANFQTLSIAAGEYAAASIDGDDINSNIAGRSLTLTSASPDTLDADSELYTDTKCIWIESPTDADDFKSIWISNEFASVITKVWCESDQTVNMDLQIDDGTPEDVMGTDLVCASTPVSDSSSLTGAMADGDRLDLVTTSTSGDPTWVSICWSFTKAD